MRSVHHILRSRLHERAGLPLYSFEELAASEWSPLFERLMRNRLIMGAMRYGRLGEEGKPSYDRVASMRKRLDAYVETGNLEHLVDVANLCLCEFEEGRHTLRHLHSQDDPEHHTQTK